LCWAPPSEDEEPAQEDKEKGVEMKNITPQNQFSNV